LFFSKPRKKEKRAAEFIVIKLIKNLFFQNQERKGAADTIANKELVFQN
jgi:hypothetical protein